MSDTLPVNHGVKTGGLQHRQGVLPIAADAALLLVQQQLRQAQFFHLAPQREIEIRRPGIVRGTSGGVTEQAGDAVGQHLAQFGHGLSQSQAAGDDAAQDFAGAAAQ